MDHLIQASLGLLPVLFFLTSLVFLDSYKLVRFSSILVTILIGCVAALLSLFVNNSILGLVGDRLTLYSRYSAPLVEETFKAGFFIYLLKTKRIGFLVDAAIYGFAIGAGFSLVENIYYLSTLQNADILLWMIRGFGTAIMHGGTMAILGMLSKNISDRYSSEKLLVFLPGLVVAIAIHSFFNHFLFSPLVTTVVQLLSLPIIILIVFHQSEKSLRFWLEVGFDMDVLILDMIVTGNIGTTRIGKYLHSLTERLPGEVVADMLCLLRTHLELSIRAKGILLLREAGFEVPADPEIAEKFKELRYLEKSIGKTGRLALSPFLHTTSRELWQLHMLHSR